MQGQTIVKAAAEHMDCSRPAAVAAAKHEAVVVAGTVAADHTRLVSMVLGHTVAAAAAVSACRDWRQVDCIVAVTGAAGGSTEEWGVGSDGNWGPGGCTHLVLEVLGAQPMHTHKPEE